MFKFTVLFFLALCFTACTADAPQTVEASIAPHLLKPAPNVTDGERIALATYQNAQFVAYKDGNGATALVNGKVTEFAKQPFKSQPGEWTVSDSVTGDYFVLNTVTGVTFAKIGGVYGVFTPE